MPAADELAMWLNVKIGGLYLGHDELPHDHNVPGLAIIGFHDLPLPGAEQHILGAYIITRLIVSTNL